MKKAQNLFGLVLILLGCIASQSWAGEASFFDQNIGKIIRAYGDANGAFIEVKSINNQVDAAFNVSCGSATADNPLRINLSATSDVSLAYDQITRKAYVFYQTSTLQFAACSIISSSVSTYSISGTVKTSGGSPISGVQMSLSGGASVATGTDGSYSFTSLSSGNYTVTPTKSNYNFSPSSTSVTISGVNNGNVNFVGTETVGIGPDLTLGRVGVPSGMHNGVYFDIVVPVKNIGSQSVGISFKVSGYISGSSTFSERLPVMCSSVMAGLPAGQETNTTLKNCYFNNQPNHRSSTVFVVVDSDKQVTETNETNNRAQASMYIYSLD